ncbi:FAD-binding oxidoreductase [Pseudooceanicola sp. CBS1P-1]|uniref:FAD-binding protein n=1 Tax=Pseudooceanicola albus TaxID=2692189 RepID=A0A6L7G8X9_9RHOB|nr:MULTISPECIES: FAD-binding oxidoreductase [Pseudooceanicola]MBT9384406.1 FAD-binding oxidoreductase [Pseudooceanicola endophyticus]MXN19856.1 FAD-binding protein [Pseudooceanicola albus]
MSDALLSTLLGILGPRGLLTEPSEIAPFVTDFRDRRTGTALAVALPATVEEAAATVRAVTGAGLPVFPQGGNTGLCYGAVPRRGVVIALRRLNRMREADAGSGLLSVDAGMTLTEVHAAAEALGLQFPLHLGAEGTAQIGGLISTNAGGTAVFRYGAMRDLVAGVEVVLADGQVFSDMKGLRKDNTGYPLSQLFCGAEGTLGLVTGAVLRLHPRMNARAHAWLALDTPEAALEAGARIRAAFGTTVEALELIDRNEALYVLAHVPGNRLPFDTAPAYSLMVEIAGNGSDSALSGQLEEVLAGIFEDGLVRDAIIAQNEKQGAEIWHFRHSVTEANKLNGIGVVLDTSVRPSAIPGFIAAADAVTAERFPEAERCIVCHMADGNVHYIVMFPFEAWARFPDAEAKEIEVEEAIHDVAARFGGSFSAEHGIGRKLTSEMARLVDPLKIEMMQRLRLAFDPEGLMNPGALLPR